MEKTFKYKELELRIKTNMLRSGICYFGEKDVQAEFDKIVRKTTYHVPDLSRENLLVTVWRNLIKIGIKPVSITDKEITYRGVNMANISDKQKELE